MKIFLLLMDVIIAFALTIKLLNADNSRNRGTNKVTRFVRDGAANHRYSKVQGAGVAATIIFTLFGFLAHCLWVGLPTLIPVVVALLMKRASTKSAQRVKDARSITKGALEVSGSASTAVGVGVGAAVGGALGGAGGVILGSTAGASVGAAAGMTQLAAAQQMTDVDGFVPNTEELSQTLEEGARTATLAIDYDAFMKKAIDLGVASEGDSIETAAEKVYAIMADSAKQQLGGRTKTEAAALYLTGNV